MELTRFLLLTIITAPPNFHWQAWLERTFPSRTAAEDSARDSISRAEQGSVGEKHSGLASVRAERKRLSWRNTFLKWFIDCITMGALMNTVAFLVLMGFMKGKTLEEVQLSVRKVCDLVRALYAKFVVAYASYRIPCPSFWRVIDFGHLPRSLASRLSLSNDALCF